MIYHNVIVNLCTALLGQPDLPHDSLPFSPRQSLDHSRICLETLVRLYYLRHSFQSADAYMVQPLMELGVAALRRLKSDATSPAELEDARGALVLAAQGLLDQSKIYEIGHTIFQLLNGDMRPEDASLAHRLLDIRKETLASRSARTRHGQAQYVCNVVDITKDPEQQRLNNLIARYEELAVEEAGPEVASAPASR